MCDTPGVKHLLYAVCLAAVLIRNGGQSLSPVRPGRACVTNRYPLVGVLLIRRLLVVIRCSSLLLDVTSLRIGSLCSVLPLPVLALVALSGPDLPLPTIN